MERRGSNPPRGRPGRPPFAAWPVLAIGLAELALLVAAAGGYGYHRDELYFIEAGGHPAFGYDDQPPLTPLIGRASAALFGETPTGLRVASALALAACVVLAALTARELGGGRRAQVLAAASLAVAIWAPNLLWQADHGLPQRDLSGQIADEEPLVARLIFIPFQLLIVSPLLAPFWIAGVMWLLRDDRARPFRALGAGYLALVVICLVTGGKFYYAWGWYPALLAAGGVALEGWLARPRRRLLAATAVGVSAAVSALISLPLVPARSLPETPIPALNENVLETVGWPRFVDTVATVWGRLPAGARSRAVIFTANYGEAGAIRRFGPDGGPAPGVLRAQLLLVVRSPAGPRGAGDRRRLLGQGLPGTLLRGLPPGGADGQRAGHRQRGAGRPNRRLRPATPALGRALAGAPPP